MIEDNLFTQHDTIQEMEQRLRRKLSDAYGSPFIAHYDIPSELEQAALDEIIFSVGGRLARFLELMPKFPCVCTRTIAASLAESYGDRGDHSIYEPIAKRLEVGETIPMHHRERLHYCFRNACHTLGLALPPRTTDSSRMVDDYLFQAGVSHNQLPRLAQAFLRAERAYGLPHGDDTRQVDGWEDRAVEFASHGLTVLRRIVQQDPTGFHATSFINFRRRINTVPASDFERAFHDAIDDPSNSNVRGISTDQHPSLEFSEGELQLAIPKDASRLEIKVSNRTYELRGGRKLPLPLPWPSEINWRNHRNTASSLEWQPLRVFSDPSRILVFDGDSGFCKRELNPLRPSEQNTPAGPIYLLAKRSFQANGEPCHHLGQDAFVLYCDVSKELNIQLDDFLFSVDVDPRLNLHVDGVKVARNQGAWLIAKPTIARVRGEMGTFAENLEVRIEHSAFGSTLVRPVLKMPDGSAIAQLDLPTGGEFGLARVSLHVQGQNRALYRSKFWFWPGLEQFLDGKLFDAPSIPKNLSKENLSHIVLNNEGYLVLRTDEAYLRAQLSFQVNRRIVRFDFPPPGESISVRRSDGEVRPLKAGASLVVREDDYASCLIVRCSDRMAAVDIKGRVIPQAFGRIGSWRASFAMLSQDGSHNRVRILPHACQESARDLVRIVPAANPKSFDLKRIGSRQILESCFECSIDGVRIEAENLISGEKQHLELPVDVQDISPAKVWNLSDDGQSVKIELDGNDYSDGVWFIEFAIREKGREDWMPVINAFGESYVSCAAPESYSMQLAPEYVSDWKPDEAAEIFLRLTRVIGIPISRQCRDNVNELLLSAWRKLGKSLAESSTDQATLLKACGIPPAAHAKESWLPLRHPIEIAPKLFAAPAEEFEQLARSDLAGYGEFEAVGLAGITMSLQDACDVLDINLAFLTGFQNAAELQRNANASPGAFDFHKYYRAIKAIDDIDRPLSIQRHHRACERMAERCARVGMGNTPRMGWAMTLVKRFQQRAVDFVDFVDAPAELVEEFPLIAGTPCLISALARASRIGHVDQFWDDATSYAQKPLNQVRKDVGLLLRLAPELLAFYLLLWVLVERNSEQCTI